MKTTFALIGIIFFAIGGAILSLDITNIALGLGHNIGRDTAMIQSVLIGFVGFLL